MMGKSLLAGASLLALGLVPTAAQADPLTISTATTTPVKTSTAANNSAGDITVTSAGSVKPTVAGAAVTVDSNNSVANAGAIGSTDVSDSTAIQIAAGTSGTISNTGTIQVDESYTRTDTNSDTVLDGAYAQGSNRFGIRTLGSFTGNVTSSGAIGVEGNNSGAISLGGPLTGDLTVAGSAIVTGDNSVAIRTGAVTGNVTLSGTIVAAGTGSSAVLIGDDVGGTFKFNATSQSTGYSTVNLPTSLTGITAGNMLQGGPTIIVAGNVAGGVQIMGSTTITNADNTTTTVPAAAITSFGSAPALSIGSSTRTVTLGAITGDANGFGLLVGGTVSAGGLFAGIEANAIKLGGQGNAVSVANGIRVTGAIAAVSNAGSSTGFHLASGTTTPTFVNSGSIGANTVGTVATGTTPVVTALLIGNGASLASLNNSGAIVAKGVTGTTTRAIMDESGTLKAITNTGMISATTGTTNVAIDLRSVTSGASVTQSAAANAGTTPQITGAILFGGGSNSLAVSAGSVNGDVTFAGAGNSLTLSNAATFVGNADFAGTAGTMTLGGTSSFSGAIKNGANTNVVVNGATLAPASGVSTAASLVMNGGTLRVTVDGSTGTASQLQISGNASFAAGTSVAVQFTRLGQLGGNFTVLQAGSLTGANNLTLATSLPYLFTGSLTTNTTTSTVNLTVARKSASQLGLTGNVAAIYDPALVAAASDDPLGNRFLALTSSAGVTETLTQLMPVYETGALDAASLATRAANGLLGEHTLPSLQAGNTGAWIQMIGWADKKNVRSTQGYSTFGAGFVLGVERAIGDFGRIGVSGVYGWGVNKDVITATAANTTHAQAGLFWRGTWGGFHAYATGAYGRLGYNNSRVFDPFTRTASATWNASLISGGAGMSWELGSGQFYARPSASVDYVQLKEKGYTETGGGAGVNLIINPRTSSETGVNGALALGLFLRKPAGRNTDFFKVELEGGARHLLNTKIDNTVAHFAGGSNFSLTPEARKAGWTARLRVMGGGDSFSMSGEVGAEQQQNHIAATARVGIHFAL